MCHVRLSTHVTAAEHVCHVRQVVSEEAQRAKSDPTFYLKAASSQAREAVVRACNTPTASL